MTQRMLLCSDMDRTIIPNGGQPEHAEARKRFTQFCQAEDVCVVYVTGRYLQLVIDAIGEYDLPEPDYIVSDVGTKIYHHCGKQWSEWDSWFAEIDREWCGKTHSDLMHLLNDMPQLLLQEEHKQNHHKLSYYLSLSADHESIMAEMQQRLDDYGVHATLVWSIDEPEHIGLLDVLPRNATKLHAVEFLYEQLGYQRDHVVYAGDSGNDLTLMASAIPSVLVANAAQDVRDSALTQAQVQHNEAALYFACGAGSDMNGNYSAGVLEGVGYFVPDMRARLGQMGFCYE